VRLKQVDKRGLGPEEKLSSHRNRTTNMGGPIIHVLEKNKTTKATTRSGSGKNKGTVSKCLKFQDSKSVIQKLKFEISWLSKEPF